ncbi:MAG TPA: rhomboid family intramembrane serine protease [Opitutaceae bacterium]|nr:rhomboid family intramembrane serine protease [Opitutaceae bacterium]
MQTVSPGQSELRYDVAYQEFAGNRYNRDFKGKGALVIQPGPRFVFSGSKRKLIGEPQELAFAADQIWNVQAEGLGVQFMTGLGEAGRKKQPFIFFCRTAQEAAVVALRLPQTRDADFLAGREFAARLRDVAGPGSAWTSVTNAVVAVNVVVFVLMGLAGAGWFEVADMMPYIRYGANRADATTDGEWWRLVTSMFLHYGILHLALNMWALIQAGHLAEKLFGRASYAMAYFGSGLMGSVATLLWHREKLVWSAGASGAVFGIYGAVLGYMLREKQQLPRSVYVPLQKSTIAFAGYNLLYGLVHPTIDNAAHLGGLAGGVVLGWILALPVDAGARARGLRSRLGLALTTVAAVVGVGLAAAPTFVYRVSEELAWQELNKPYVTKESGQLAREAELLKALEKGQRRSEAERWIGADAIPLYAAWRKEVLARTFTPGRATEIRRTAFADILRLKLEAYEALRTALQEGDAQAVARYRIAEAHIVSELQALRRRRK